MASPSASSTSRATGPASSGCLSTRSARASCGRSTPPCFYSARARPSYSTDSPRGAPRPFRARGSPRARPNSLGGSGHSDAPLPPLPAPHECEDGHRVELRVGQLRPEDALRLRERAPRPDHPLGSDDQVEGDVVIRHREWLAVNLEPVDRRHHPGGPLPRVKL